MNFFYRDRFGKVDEVLRQKHFDESVTVDAFVKHSQGKTLRELQFEAGPANPAELGGIEISEQGLGPQDHRYVQDVNNPGRVIDMRHFIESADVPGIFFGNGEGLGVLIEIQQGNQKLDSAWEKEDLNSNFLGTVFRNNYYDADGDVSQQFQDFFTDYENGELKGFAPAAKYLIDDVIDLGKDAKRAYQQLENSVLRQIDRLEQLSDAASQQLRNRLSNALDTLRSAVDPPDSRNANANVDARELEFLEKFVGRAWNNPNPLTTAGDILTNTFNRLSVEFEKRLLIQVADLPVGYITTSENFVFSGEATEAIELLGQIIN